MKTFVFLSPLAVLPPARAQLTLSRGDYIDRVHAIWTGQIIAVLVALESHPPTVRNLVDAARR
jgi:hypothetical protein